ncbi:MAG: M20/M25/M40 family metallo-hydrolase [Clostridia bacterium]|nr:M20/M25/M40 family metallo-hydrolase [Clostridia bacterium]MDR3645608.1 M20/M25/M40 family metallo-hydrolase [Clostridia bacterium]
MVINMLWFLWAALAAVAVLAAVLLLRAALFRPPEQGAAGPAAEPTASDEAVERFSQLLQKKTVSNRDPARMDPVPFEEFIALLPALYPKVHAALTRERVAQYSLLYRWKGREPGKPAVLMAHYDVVPAPPEGWEQPPFDGAVRDGVIWGRGSIDTKVTLTAIFESAERLCGEGFVPLHDIYLSFGHDEEIGGVNGTPSIVALLRERGIAPRMVMDEGGAIVEGIFPGVHRPIAVVGTAEKGRTDLEIIANGAGGHASAPPKDDAAAQVARAILRMRRRPFPASFPDTTLEMLDVLGRYTPFGLRIIFANLWLFRPLLLRMFTGSGGETGAMCRTTFAVTMLEGSDSANMLPARVRAVANIRNAVGESVGQDITYIKRVVKDDSLSYNTIFASEPSPVSDTGSEGFRLLRQTVAEIFPGAIVTPYVMIAQSDSRHYAPICKNIFRFVPIELSKKERESVHNVNECLPVSKFAGCIEFYARLIKKL